MRLVLQAATRTWSTLEGLNTEVHLTVDAHGMPARFFVTAGATADCAVAAQPIEGFAVQYLLADRRYGTNEIIAFAQDSGIETVIPSKKNRRAQRDCDHCLYKLRH
jgi:hypothetical protein